MYTFITILLLSIVILVALYTIGFHIWKRYESFSDFSIGKSPPIAGISPEYFYAFLPTLAREMMEYIEKEIDGSPKKHGDVANEAVKTFHSALMDNTQVKQKYMDTKHNIIMTSTKLAIFLGMEDQIGLKQGNAKFASALYVSTSSGASKIEFINHMIRRYFQNYMTVNALDAYRAGVMPLFSVIRTIDTKDDDTLVSEASIVLDMMRKASQTYIGGITETIPSFSMSRQYMSVQDRLEAKAYTLFQLIQSVDITKIETLRGLSEVESIHESTSKARTTKQTALEQVQSYTSPFLVALMRSLTETTRLTPSPSLRFDKDGMIVSFASKTGVSAPGTSLYSIQNVNTLGSGYVPNALILLSDTEEDAYKDRLRNMFAILMKRLQAKDLVQNMCETNQLSDSGVQNCSRISTTVDDSELVSELVYYLMGFYKKNTTKGMIEKEMSDLMALSKNNLKGLSDDYIKAGLFTTDELILLNHGDHRLHFVGPYTACLRHVISHVASISGQATLREDLILFDDER